MTNSKKHIKAYTFIEVLTAIFILTVGIFAISNLQISNIISNKNSYLKNRALFLATEFIEKIKILPYDKIKEDSIKKDIFLISWNIKKETSNYKLMELKINWKINNKNKNIKFKFLKTKEDS